MHLGIALLCLGSAAILLLGGSGLLLWVAYQFLSQSLGPLAATLVSGLALLLLGGLLAWLAARLAR